MQGQASALIVEPVTLVGRWVRLDPLKPEHASELASAAADDEIWRYMPSHLRTLDDVHDWIAAALHDQAAGIALPFAIIDQATGQAIGSTRYLDIRPRDRGLEIGWTWLRRSCWRTPVNTESKYLLLRHAFETLGCIRVQFKTHRLNFRSRRALERIGAQFEGILRNHLILPDGTYRDSAYYSVIEHEWPAVKRHLSSCWRVTKRDRACHFDRSRVQWHGLGYNAASAQAGWWGCEMVGAPALQTGD